MSDKKFYLTTPIYYVNARPHIGHAYSTIVGDVLARRHRLLGEETYFLTGTDEHGQKIERSAAAAGIAPQAFADQVSETFRMLWKRMGITNNQFIRTTSEKHKVGVQKLFREIYEKGKALKEPLIYLSSYTGSYCVSDEAFVDAPVGTACPDCGRLLEEVTEENFFFRLSAFQERLIELIESDGLKITPDSAKNEVLSFVRGGLKDLSISRSSFTWGIPVPDDIQREAGATQKHVVYVWLDALANYMTALGYGSEDDALWQRFWPADVHLVGKEITRFHCVYWPAFLMAAGLPTPKQVTANGWLLFDNAKMSKSKGNVVRAETILDGFGDAVYGKQFPESTKPERDLFASDVLRYFLLREIPFGQDGSFSFEAMITRYNADLANGYGNLVSRTLKLVQQNRSSVVPGEPRTDWDERLWVEHAMSWDQSHHMPDESGLNQSMFEVLRRSLFLQSACEAFYKANSFLPFLAELQLLIMQTDGFLSAYAPWKLAKDFTLEKQRDFDEVIYVATEGIRFITALLYPLLPYSTSKVWAQLGLGDIEAAAKNGELKDLTWGGLRPGTKLGPLAPIFPRADKGLIDIMTDMENPTPAAEPTATTDPAAPPRTASLDEPGGRLSVAGSHAHTTGPDPALTAESGQLTAPADASPQIAIDDFVKIELRVAEVVVCDRVPKADKLLRLEIDLGYEKRQILSGIAEWYAPEEMVGKRIIVIANLAPRKMRGLESHGMLLAASEEGGKPMLATVPEGVKVGTRLK
jgi:methionyl-tRNA synthetase